MIDDILSNTEEINDSIEKDQNTQTKRKRVKYKQVLCYMHPAIADKLKRISEHAGVSVSSLIQQSVILTIDYLEELYGVRNLND